jgi:hypothetical protein
MHYLDTPENGNLHCNPERVTHKVILKLQNTHTAHTEWDAFPEEQKWVFVNMKQAICVNFQLLLWDVNVPKKRSHMHIDCYIDILLYISGWRTKHFTYTLHIDSPSYSV